MEGGGDGGVVDLDGARFASAGHVGDLDLPDPVDAVADEPDEVSLADLGVVWVEVHPQVGAVYGLDEGSGVGGPCEGGAGVVDGGVEVFQAEHDALSFAERRDAGQRFHGGPPHGTGDGLHRLYG